MRIAIGADHAGFALKERLRMVLAQSGHEVADHGAVSEESCDYPDFAAAVAREVAGGFADYGVLVCDTGAGMSIAANKIPGVQARAASFEEAVRLLRRHNDANVLTFGAKFIDSLVAESMLEVFLSAEFEGGHHARRVAKIAQLEQHD